MTRRNATVVLAAVVAALVGVALLGFKSSPIHRKTTLGLDLQGGLEVTLKAVPPKGQTLQKSDLDRSVSIMRSRVDKLGVAEPVITKQGSDQIAIQLPGVRDPEAAAKVIGKTAQLEFYDLEADLVAPSIDINKNPIPKPSIYALLSGQQALVKPTSDAWYVFDAKHRLRVGPVPTKQQALNSKALRAALRQPSSSSSRATQSANTLPKGWKLFATPPKTVLVECGVADGVCPGVNSPAVTQSYYYLLKHDPPNVPEMTGTDLKLSGTKQDFDTTPGHTGEPIVLLSFTGHGRKKFEEITRAEAQRGKLLTNTIGNGTTITQHFAIVLDREIKSWPQIDWTQYPNGISGSNGAQISGNFSVREAKDLALVLQTGALPVKFVTLDQTAISATLGKDSLKEAKRAALVGLLIVALFLVIFYRFLGVVAVLGLGVYAAFLYAAILLFNVTLTLPGFAGLVLTLGVAADANVVIFERVKEESRAGHSMRRAIAQGYARGFHTIIDANVVTAITAFVLFAVATATVKGFALMLLIGTAISMLTAVVFTRALLSLLAGFSWIENVALMGATGRGIRDWLKVDFIGKRRLWFVISGAVVAISITALGIRGLNLGIDFKGGTQITFKTPAPASLERVRAEAARIGRADAVIQGRGATTGADSYRSFQVRTRTLTNVQSQAFASALQKTVAARAFGTKSVSASFGRQIARQAIFAILVSLLLITIYVSFRFQWKFALPVLVALAHDIAIAVGVYALAGREVTTATVAAILTVLGYSIYDTIIIFDRIRENIPLMRRASMRVLTNVSLWETIPRSLATTFITLLPIVSLLTFGGATLKDFAFALLVGITSGAYSSIFVAAPLVALLKEREPEYKRRLDDETALIGVESVGGGLVQAPEAQPAAAVAATPAVAPAAASSKRDRRRQRRSSRPHGRAR
ncbi:MAG: protein translocase subunit SecD [Actinobacteria bacterium]|nr:MAG: protein translocase subunit SecD [Actinomycetota bacterium]